MNAKLCYACWEPACTREHVPPKSFYPEGLRNNLIVVPSCARHNNANSHDVEYVRILLISEFRTSQRMIDSINPKLWRKFDRTPWLLNTAFRDITPLIFEGQETAAFTIDGKRFNNVIETIATGMYFHSFNKLFLGRWVIFSPSTFDTDELRTGRPGKYQELREKVPRLRLRSLATPHPEAFACQLHFESMHELVFEFRFYEGIKVYAISIPFWKKFPRSASKQ